MLVWKPTTTLTTGRDLTLNGRRASCPPASILDKPDFFLPLVMESIGSYTLTVLDSDEDLTQQTSNLPLHMPALK